MGSTSVSYDAVTNAITGLIPGTRYAVYCYDQDYIGGARTWYASTSPAYLMQIGDGVVYAGEATIPFSGSSSGGAGGWCVDVDMYLPDGRRAGQIEAGDSIVVWDDDPLNPGFDRLVCQRNQIVDDQWCHRIVTTSGASVVASDSTPMTLRNGEIVRIVHMLNEYALVMRDSVLRWERVIECVSVGRRRVAKIVVHNRSYFAGSSCRATIATHNPLLKP